MAQATPSASTPSGRPFDFAPLVAAISGLQTPRAKQISDSGILGGSGKTPPSSAGSLAALGAASLPKSTSSIAAAGGGSFVSSGRTHLTVGDNPGGAELVTVTPLSGKGQTTADGGGVKMAGGGALLGLGQAALGVAKSFMGKKGVAGLARTFSVRGMRAGLGRALGPKGRQRVQQAKSVADFTAAIVKLVPAAEAFARGLLEGQRHLAEFSSSMAMVMAQSDVRKILREREVGDRTAGTTGTLQRAVDDLSDSMKESRVLTSNVMNLLGSVVSRAIEPLAKGIDAVAGVGNKILEKMGVGEGEKTIDMGKWLEEVKKDADRTVFRRPTFR